jgi:hypothetical protein
VVGIEGVKKESDASGKVNAQSAQARATSDPVISIADLLKLVKGDAKKYIPAPLKSTETDTKSALVDEAASAVMPNSMLREGAFSPASASKSETHCSRSLTAR